MGAMTEDHYASIIRKYWFERGYAVDVGPRAMAVKGKNGTVHYHWVRSNLINGLPPGYQGRAIDKIAVAG